MIIIIYLKKKKIWRDGGISLYCWIKKLKDVLYRIFSIQVIKTPHIIRINGALNVMQSTQLLTNLQPCY